MNAAQIPDKPRPPTHPSDMALDAGGPAIDAHVAGCAPCRWRVESARLASERFEKEVLPRTLPLVRERLTRRRWTRLGFWIATPALAAACAIFFLRPPAHITSGPVDPPWSGIKGSAPSSTDELDRALEIYVKRGDKVWRLDRSQKLRPRDSLRWIVRGDRPRYLRVLSRDGAGRTSRLFPASAEAGLVHPGDELPGSFILDDAPGPETLTIVFSDAPDLGSPTEFRLSIDKDLPAAKP